MRYIIVIVFRKSVTLNDGSRVLKVYLLKLQDKFIMSCTNNMCVLDIQWKFIGVR